MELLKSNNGGILYYLYENLGEIQCDIFFICYEANIGEEFYY